jgi:hypothetical protein
MSRLKKILLAIFIGFVAIQFIQPARNTNGQVLATDITTVVSVPDYVHTILKEACYDCHSNNTNYPFYAYIQPIGWLLNRHIQDGKSQLNFSDFGSLSQRRKESKLKSIANQIKDEAMPLPAYTILHKNAILSKAEKDLIISWANTAKDSLSQ